MSDGRTWGAVVGAVAGYFTGGLSYVATGITIGSAVGGLLEPKKKTETNRIDDIKVSLSKYGDGIPETWGNNIPSATAVWSTFIIELPDEPTGGKGGGVENTNYRQFIQSMWCLGRTPPPGSTVTIRKAWIDGKLNYDASGGLSVSQALANEENPFTSVTLFDGQDGQLPHPIIEQYEGVGNVPAFTGRICIFIFGLQCPGGRIPQLQFELCVDPQEGNELLEIQPIPGFPDAIWYSGVTHSNISYGIAEYGGFGDDPRTLEVYRVEPSRTTKILVRPLDFNEAMDTGFVGVHGNGNATAVRSKWLEATSYEIEAMDLEEGGFVSLGEITAASQVEHAYRDGDVYALVFRRNDKSDPLDMLVLGDGMHSSISLPAATAENVALRDGQVFAITNHGGSTWLARYSASTGSLISEVEAPMLLSVPGAGPFSTTVLSEVSLYLAADVAYVLDSASGLLWRVDDSSWTPIADYSNHASTSLIAFGGFYANDQVAMMGVWGVGFMFMRHLTYAPQPTSVRDIIESQNLRSGLTAEQFDVETIDDTVWGITFKSPSSARANITPLMTYAAIGVVEEDGALRYFHRADKSSIDTVPYVELGCAEDGAEPGDPFPLARSNAQEFPRSITITYNDQNFDYQQSTVKAMRYAVDTVMDETQVLDVATDGGTAASIAHRLLYERWLAQNTRSFSVSRKYAHWSAGDVVTFLRADGTAYGAFMLSNLTDTGALIEGECFPADGELAIQTVPGPGGYRQQEIDELPSLTTMVIGDWPLLRDADNNPGIYVAMDSQRGASLYVGDDDNSLEGRGAVTGSAPAGIADTVLGDFSLNVSDEANTVIISMGDDELTSTTDSLMLSSNVNYAAIGAPGRWELIQFRTAEDLGGDRYELSGFLRGKRGTEHNRGNHQVGDTFVLLNINGILRPNMDLGALNTTKRYRAVSLGRSLNSAPSRSYSNTGEGLRPFSPIDLELDYDGDDIVFTWLRRTRLSTNWLTGIVPLGEASELYEVVLFTDGTFSTITRLLLATSTTATYTLAQQTADGYTPGDPIYVRVFQMSDSVGRGNPLEATL